MRVSDLVKDLIFLVGSVECFAQVGFAGLSRLHPSPAQGTDRALKQMLREKREVSRGVQATERRFAPKIAGRAAERGRFPQPRALVFRVREELRSEW